MNMKITEEGGTVWEGLFAGLALLDIRVGTRRVFWNLLTPDEE